MSTFKRIVTMAAGAVLCASVATFVAFFIFLKQLPPSDLAYGKSVFDMLCDPLVLLMLMPIVAGGACIGLVQSARLLWRVRLARAIPVVTLVTVAAVAASAAVFMPISPVVGLISATATMHWCRRRPGWQLEPST